MGQRPGISFKMNANPQRRRLGWVLLGVLAAVCLLCDALVWWLAQQPMAMQPAGLSIVLDMRLICQAAWGILFIQPVVLSVYLAYGKQNSFIRVAVVLLALSLAYAVQLIGWWFVHDSTNWSIMRQRDINQIALLIAIQSVSFSVAMWLSRIMRGWHLSNHEDADETEERSVFRLETITESAMLVLLAVAVILGPQWFLSGVPFEIGPLYFAINGLVGTFVLAPIAFVSLRFRQFFVVGSVLLLPLVVLPAVVLGLLIWLRFLSGDTSPFIYYGPVISTIFGGGMLAATLAALRLAGFRLHKRSFPKTEIVRAPVDPFSD